MSQETKRILKKNPAERTVDEVKYVGIGWPINTVDFEQYSL